jgi:hypothetical protein
MPTLQRFGSHGFFIGQQLQQPIVLNLISRRIAFRFGYQPPVEASAQIRCRFGSLR